VPLTFILELMVSMRTIAVSPIDGNSAETEAAPSSDPSGEYRQR
jgi:hypothetical protein